MSPTLHGPPTDGDSTTRRSAPDLSAESGRTLAPGTQVAGRYWVLGIAGSGGMGHVYRAYDPRLEREVALKQVRVLGRGAQQRLADEARSMAQLSHPNVIAVYDVVMDDGGLTLAMEYVSGRTLRDWLGTPRAQGKIIAAFVEAGRGLAAAHTHGLTHRDFKPGNVLVAEDGRTRVTDFGLAKPDVARSTGPSSARGGTVEGTPRYMAPEQLDGRVADARSDQYAFCLALWEALAGTDAFPGPPETLAARKHGGAPPWPKSVPTNGGLVAAVERGLQARPADRWPAMCDLLDAIVAARPSRRTTRVGVLALLVAAAAGVAGVMTADPDPCAQSGDGLRDLWDADAQQRVLASIGAAADPLTARRATVLVGRLETYAAQWVRAARDNCEATVVKGEQPVRLMDRATLCLDRSRAQFAAALDAVVERTAANDRESLASLVSELPSLEHCRDSSWLSADIAPPAHPRQAALVRGLETRLARVEARHKAGDSRASLDALSSLDPEIEDADYAPLIARAFLLRGEAALTMQRLEDAEAALRRAYHVALSAGDDRTAVAAARQLGHLRGIEMGQLDEGLLLLDAATAVGQRPSVDARERLRTRGARGLLLQRLGRHGDALKELRTAHGEATQALAADDVVRSELAATLGVVLYENGLNKDALALHTTVLATRTKALGPEHPTTAGSRVNIAIALDALGRPEEAARELQRARRAFRLAYGDTHPNVALCDLNLSVTHAHRGDSVAALRSVDAALRQYRSLYGDAHDTVGRAHSARAEALNLAERFDEAALAYRNAVAVSEAAGGTEQFDALRYRVRLARVLSRAGHVRRAEQEARAVLAAMQRSLLPTNPELDLAWETLGEILIKGGRPREAIPILERLMQSGDTAQQRSSSGGVIAFKLARALREAGETERSLALAREARHGLTSANRYATDLPLVAEIDAWLVSAPPQRLAAD